MSSERVAAAMSGGVDSSVAAALLVDRGCYVVGVTMRLYDAEAEGAGSCAERDAREVAEKLGIEHHVVDLREEFAQCVVDNFVEEYQAGRTPNPCVRCNQLIKFGALMRYAERELGASRMATGHYARVVWDEGANRWKLLRGVDKAKDQSYVLYRLSQDQLGRILMPVGVLTKSESRSMAEALGLGVSDRAESQDVCFIPQGRYQDYLAKHVPDAVRPGPIVDTSGRVIGEHPGIANCTVGQRRGLRVASGQRLYVVAIDAASNTVVLGPASALAKKRVALKDVTLISGEILSESVAVSARIRYNAQDSAAVLRPLENNWAELVFEKEQQAVTPGQSAVFYKGEEVLGGGVIAGEMDASRAISED